jgi:hypothetical protein
MQEESLALFDLIPQKRHGIAPPVWVFSGTFSG